jgi:hypothetical protein
LISPAHTLSVGLALLKKGVSDHGSPVASIDSVTEKLIWSSTKPPFHTIKDIMSIQYRVTNIDIFFNCFMVSVEGSPCIDIVFFLLQGCENQSNQDHCTSLVFIVFESVHEDVMALLSSEGAD